MNQPLQVRSNPIPVKRYYQISQDQDMDYNPDLNDIDISEDSYDSTDEECHQTNSRF
jgi:hypothetical protein